jgi:hypothetical protein
MLVMQSRNLLVVPPDSLERTLQVSIGEDRKSRLSDCFSVLASLSSYRCDLTFAYDVISILHVLFVFLIKKRRVFWGEFTGYIFFFMAYLILYVSLPDISICEH